MNIDYQLMGEAQRHFAKRNFQHIDVPWSVGEEAYKATKPPGVNDLSSSVGFLVASGEQSLIQLMIDGKLKPGRWSCVTPCWRDEPIQDELHLERFLKLELIHFMPKEKMGIWLGRMIADASMFFEYYLGFVKQVTTETGYDLVSRKGIELGSYGIRRFQDFQWIYGTGCALPRLSQAMMIETTM